MCWKCWAKKKQKSNNTKKYLARVVFCRTKCMLLNTQNTVFNSIFSSLLFTFLSMLRCVFFVYLLACSPNRRLLFFLGTHLFIQFLPFCSLALWNLFWCWQWWCSSLRFDKCVWDSFFVVQCILFSVFGVDVILFPCKVYIVNECIQSETERGEALIFGYR